MKKLFFLILISTFTFSACSLTKLISSDDVSEDVIEIGDIDEPGEEIEADDLEENDKDTDDEEVLELDESDESDDSNAISDFFTDDVAVHNGLVDRMDAVLNSEEIFYAAYYDIEEGDSVVPVKEAYDYFLLEYDGLVEYMASTSFVSDQQVFVTQYENVYEPSLDNYIKVAGEFVDFIEENGYTFDSTSDYIDLIDTAGGDFVDVHNNFIDIVNLQSDY